MTLLLAHNTPERIVSAAISHGFYPVIMPPMDGMASPVASHPDMLLFFGFGKLFARSSHLESAVFSASVREILRRSPNLTLCPASDAPSAKYPSDVAFNCLHLPGVALIGKADYVSRALCRTASLNMTPVIDTRQGYSKCSSAVLGDGGKHGTAVITADPSIYATVTECGVHAAKISPGHVSLPGYDTGFIGGASFYCDGILYFLGNIESHPDRDIIKLTAERFGIGIVSLTDDELFDAGCLLVK